MEEKEIKKMFLKLKPVRAIVTLRRGKRNYALEISRSIDATYSHTVRILQRMEEAGLLEFEQSGRKKLISLTPRGEEVARSLHDAWNVLGTQETVE